MISLQNTRKNHMFAKDAGAEIRSPSSDCSVKLSTTIKRRQCASCITGIYSGAGPICLHQHFLFSSPWPVKKLRWSTFRSPTSIKHLSHTLPLLVYLLRSSSKKRKLQPLFQEYIHHPSSLFLFTHSKKDARWDNYTKQFFFLQSYPWLGPSMPHGKIDAFEDLGSSNRTLYV